MYGDLDGLPAVRVLAGATVHGVLGVPTAAGVGMVCGAVVAALAPVSPVVVTYLPVVGAPSPRCCSACPCFARRT